METFENDRNPSPPPEMLDETSLLLPDRIGNTVYSKQWLFQILMKMLEAANSQARDSCNEMKQDYSSDNSSNDEMNENSISSYTFKLKDIIELDSDTEDKACSLWDMSANEEVAEFLYEIDASDIFLEIINKTKSPRLLEIVLGILGNMFSFEHLCRIMSTNKSLMCILIALIGTSDAPSIEQIIRLIHYGVISNCSKNIWFEAIKENRFFMENVEFILANSLNGNLLTSMLQILYYIFDENKDLCDKWSNEKYTKATIECAKQLTVIANYKGLDEFFLVLNILCQYEANQKAFAKQIEQLNKIFNFYIIKLGEEDALPPLERVIAITSCFATYGTILKQNIIEKEHIDIATEVIKTINKLFFSIYNYVIKLNENSLNMKQESLENTCINDPSIMSDNGKINGNNTDNTNWLMMEKSLTFLAKTFNMHLNHENAEDTEKIALLEEILINAT